MNQMFLCLECLSRYSNELARDLGIRKKQVIISLECKVSIQMNQQLILSVLYSSIEMNQMILCLECLSRYLNEQLSGDLITLCDFILQRKIFYLWPSRALIKLKSSSNWSFCEKLDSPSFSSEAYPKNLIQVRSLIPSFSFYFLVSLSL